MDDAYDVAKSYFIYKDRSLHGSFKVCICSIGFSKPIDFIVKLNEFIFWISQMQHEEKDAILDLFAEGIESHTPLDEFSDIQNEAELKFNKNKLIKLLSLAEESNENVNSTQKK